MRVQRMLVAWALLALSIAGAGADPAFAAAGDTSIDVWYGLDQDVALPGVPQPWFNIPGTVSDPDGVASLEYRLNGGGWKPLTVSDRRPGDNDTEHRRLAGAGDFNIDIPFTSLAAGPNTVTVRVIDGAGNSTITTIAVDHTPAPGVWPLPYTIDWATEGAVGEAALVVDGDWSLGAAGVRTLDPAYDRGIAIGDMAWTEYEVTVPITIHDLRSANDGYPGGVGILTGWQGHTDTPSGVYANGACGGPAVRQPKCGYMPFGVIAWYRTNGLLQLYDEASESQARIDEESRTLLEGRTYVFKLQVDKESGGNYFRFKVWEQGTSEPGWQLEGAERYGQDDGAILLVSHHDDVTFGDVVVNPLSGATPPTARSDSVELVELSAVEIDVLSNDSAGSAPLDTTTVNIIDDPDRGSTSIDPLTGMVTYQPAQTGPATDTFSYRVSDTAAVPMTSNQATVTITIYGPADDPDGDGLSNGQEAALGTEPLLPDTDADGLGDGAEVNTHATDPLEPDSDGDGTADGAEVWSGRDPTEPPAQVALFNGTTGQWHLRSADGSTNSFYYGLPGDVPLLGDWDCDGTDTVGMFRPGNGFAYLSNSNSFGVADLSFYFGIPGDIPMVGDWDGDGCDSLGVYRRGHVFLSNTLETAAADVDFWFGNPGDRPVSGDFDADRITEVGLYRPSTGSIYFRWSHTSGGADHSFYYGVPGDRIVAGDWDNDHQETVGSWRPSAATFFLTDTNGTVPADYVIPFGAGSWLPVAGNIN